MVATSAAVAGSFGGILDGDGKGSMKAFVALVVGFLLLAGLAGCGGEPEASPTASPARATTRVAPTATSEPARANIRVAPTATAEPVQEAGRESRTAIPAPSPTAVPSPTATTEPTRATTRVAPTATAEPARATPTPTAVPAPTSGPAPTPTAEPEPEVVRVSSSSLTRDTAPGASESDVAALVAGNSAFAFDLYRVLIDSGENLFFSPHSISLALAVAYSGARGETERQMADVLGFGLPQERLHPAFNALDLSLQSGEDDGDSGDFRLSVANSAWGQEGYGFLPEFLDGLAVNYGEGMRAVDFRRNPEDARVRINDWVAEETGERIKDLIPQGAIDDLTRLALVNAIYFKAAWRSPFDENATSDRPFHLLDGSERDVPMMRQQSRLRYAAGDGFQAVELPYEGGQVAMTVLVPDSGRFEEFQDSLDGPSFRGIVESLDRRQVRLSMPRFEMESSFGLTDALQSMGMTDAFDGQSANFSGMDGRSCGGGVCLVISNVVHKAFVSVDEEGTEAAAATAVLVGVTSADPTAPIELVIDRPFLFVIRHQATGAILFVGRVLEP